MSQRLVLLAAKDMLQERGWTKGTFARDRDGKAVPVLSDRADTFDMNGAIVRAVGGITPDSLAAASALSASLGAHVPTWQDTASFHEVLACFDRAIEMVTDG